MIVQAHTLQVQHIYLSLPNQKINSEWQFGTSNDNFFDELWISFIPMMSFQKDVFIESKTRKMYVFDLR